MAIKLGTENKRNVIIVAILISIAAYLGLSQLLSSPPSPAPSAPATAQRHSATGRASRAGGTNAVETSGEARKIPSINLDPTLHLERLTASESIEYAGTGRNIFSMDSTPIRIEKALASARPVNHTASVYTPPPAPHPPAIDLKYFGYSVAPNGTRRAFLLHGEDIFDAGVGEIVDHRFKVVAIAPTGVQITDLGYNNTQTLPLESN
jgi:hypothetical protein